MAGRHVVRRSSSLRDGRRQAGRTTHLRGSTSIVAVLSLVALTIVGVLSSSPVSAGPPHVLQTAGTAHYSSGTVTTDCTNGLPTGITYSFDWDATQLTGPVQIEVALSYGPVVSDGSYSITGQDQADVPVTPGNAGTFTHTFALPAGTAGYGAGVIVQEKTVGYEYVLRTISISCTNPVSLPLNVPTVQVDAMNCDGDVNIHFDSTASDRTWSWGIIFDGAVDVGPAAYTALTPGSMISETLPNLGAFAGKQMVVQIYDASVPSAYQGADGGTYLIQAATGCAAGTPTLSGFTASICGTNGSSDTLFVDGTVAGLSPSTNYRVTTTNGTASGAADFTAGATHQSFDAAAQTGGPLFTAGTYSWIFSSVPAAPASPVSLQTGTVNVIDNCASQPPPPPLTVTVLQAPTAAVDCEIINGTQGVSVHLLAQFGNVTPGDILEMTILDSKGDTSSGVQTAAASTDNFEAYGLGTVNPPAGQYGWTLYDLGTDANAGTKAVLAQGMVSLTNSCQPPPPPPPMTHGETTGGGANTWTNYTNAGGTAGPRIPAFTTVQITCKVQGFRVADGNTWWYRIASSPWNNQYYVSADVFYNNGATSGSLRGTPFVDSAIPDCTSGSSGGGGTTTPSGPIFTVMNTSEQLPDGVYFRNSPHTADTSRVTGLGVYRNEQVRLVCYTFGDAVGRFGDALWYYAQNITRPTNNGAPNQGYLNAHYINDSKAANVVDAGVPACTNGVPPSGGTGSPVPPGHTVINGLDVGVAQNSQHKWGSCAVQDFDGGPLGHVIVDYTHGTNIVRNGMLAGWFDNGGGPSFGCARNQEYSYGDGVRQDFDGGSLYWVAGMNHALKVNWTDRRSDNYSGYVAQSSSVILVSSTITAPSFNCNVISGTNPISFSAWAGIGGWQPNDALLQAGIQLSGCSKSGVPSYQLFWEEVPGPTGHSTTIAPVAANQSVSVKVQWFSDNTFKITMSVAGKSYPVISGTFKGGTVNGVHKTPLHSTAECVAEDPLPNTLIPFGQVTFNSCQMQSTGGIQYSVTDGPNHGANLLRVDMHLGNLNGPLEATPGLPVNPTASWPVYYKLGS